MSLNQKTSHNSHKAPQAEGHLIQLTDILIILRQRWLPGLGIGLILSSAFIIFFLSKTPLYESSASMTVEFNTDQVVNVQEVVDTGVKNSSFFETVMNTHIRRLTGRATADAVVAALPADMQRALGVPQDDAPPSETADDLSIYIAKNALDIEWQDGSQVIEVSYRHPNKYVAQAVANQFVKTYIKLQADLRSQSTDEAVDFLDDQTVELRKQLELGEQALQDYRAENKLVAIEQNRQIVTERLSELSSAITSARVKQLAIQSRAEQINRAASDLDLLMNIPSIGGRENILKIFTKLKELEREQEVLSERYYERHPRMIELTASVRSVSKDLERAIERSKQEASIELKTAQHEIDSLREEMAAAEAETLSLEKLSIEYRTLASKVESQRQTYDLVTARYNETSISQQMRLTSIRILDLAGLPLKTSWPNVPKVSLAGAALFFVTLFGLPLAMELFDNRLKTFSDIENYVGKPVLSDVKWMKNTTDDTMSRLALSEDYEQSEPFDTLYGALRLQLGHLSPPLTFVVTSSIPSEGKSIIASNLAETLGKHNYKTLVIDADLRRPSLHRYLGLPNTTGLLHWVRNNLPLTEDPFSDPELNIHKLSDDSQVYALCAGGSTKQPAPIFDDPRFDQLVSSLKQHFDILIFDTPPVGLFHDATLVADYADHTIFVARQHATTRQKTRHSVGLMDRSDAPVLGVVFNGVKKHGLATGYGYGADSYGSGYSYSDRYSYGSNKEAEKYQKSYSDS